MKAIFYNKKQYKRHYVRLTGILIRYNSGESEIHTLPANCIRDTAMTRNAISKNINIREIQQGYLPA